MTFFELLRQMVTGARTDAEACIAELEKRKGEIGRDIERIPSGDLGFPDDTALRDRFPQVSSVLLELLSDFRKVEHKCRQLDRSVREKIAIWEGRQRTAAGGVFR